MKKVLILAIIAMFLMPMALLADGDEYKESKKECVKEAVEKQISKEDTKKFINDCMRKHIFKEAYDPEDHGKEKKEKGKMEEGKK
ncbi:MAG: hypothetical protein OEL54_04425 [Flavobacteriaceae bacterium]|nr:hypothetical protein [Flavobacteriaceae bacterium]